MRTYAALTLFTLAAATAGCGGDIVPGPDSPGQAFTIDSLPSDAGWSTTLTADAVIGGYDLPGFFGLHPTPGPNLYFCRANYNGSIQPGKFRTDWGNCHFSYGGSEQWSTDYQIMTATWLAASNGAVPSGAVYYNGSYACRASYAGSKQLGKMMPGIGCYLPYGGQEIHATSYEVLASNWVQPQYVGPGAGLPRTALPGGSDVDGTTLYPCQAYVGDGEYWGKTRRDWSGCDISYNGGEQWASSFFVLTPKEVATPLGSLWTTLPVGTDTNGAPLGACTLTVTSDPVTGSKLLTPILQVGKAFASGGCAYAWSGKEIIASSGYSTFITEASCGNRGQACCGGTVCRTINDYCDSSTRTCQQAGIEGKPCVSVGGGHYSCVPGYNCNTMTHLCEGGPDCNKLGHICCPGGCQSGSTCVGVDPGYSPGYCRSTGPACGGVGQPCCNGSCGSGARCINNACVGCGLPGQVCCAGAWPCQQNGSACAPVPTGTTTGTCTQSCGASGESCCNINGQAWCAAGPNDCDPASLTCL